MILIADSGSTKTAWCLKDGDKKYQFNTQGINPSVQNENIVKEVFQSELLGNLYELFNIESISNFEQLFESPVEEIRHISAVYFYGAGCTAERRHIIVNALKEIGFDNAEISVDSDLLGAARAVCGNHPGVVGILGTGANSCLYDGKNIIDNTPSLGFILGDEGSGAYIGKRLIGDCLKKVLSDEICNMFMEETELTIAEIIEKVYRTPAPNRFLAGISRFCFNHLDNEEIHNLLVNCFVDFFRRNIERYEAKDMPINLVGSIAYYATPQITRAAELCGMRIGTILKDPIEGLISYH